MICLERREPEIFCISVLFYGKEYRKLPEARELICRARDGSDCNTNFLVAARTVRERVGRFIENGDNFQENSTRDRVNRLIPVKTALTRC